MARCTSPLAVVLLGVGFCALGLIIFFDLGPLYFLHRATTPYTFSLIGVVLMALGGWKLYKALRGWV
ncbi:MAG: hypothetical protein ETSY1_46795 (plasmid) [Candidatus Entotheonella factor]|uniref:Uncharacterized protein n=1 Tax=Entotheonella factor TaxID=1429438 RepID=W4M0A5_ENTF1|nr:MAG: hypothetical protein ETSY1_46795 [Candidatus Entotheonella factor]